MRKKKKYPSQSIEEQRRRRIARGAKNRGARKGAKSHAIVASAAENENRPEQRSGEEPTPTEILRGHVLSRDARVSIPALNLMHKIGELVPPSEANPTVECICGRARPRKPWPFSDGLGTDPVEASRRYQMMITGDYDMPQSMEALQAEATYLSIMPELAIALVAKHKAEAAKQPEPPLPPPPRPKVEVLRPAGLALAEDVPHGTKAHDVEEAELVDSSEAALDEQLRHEHVHTPKADSICPGCHHLWVIS
jgi:hypothetical protein